MNNHSKHIPLEQLADMVEERISAAARVEAEEHLATCDECEGELSRLNNLINNMRADSSVNVPRDVFFNVINLFEPRQSKASLVRRILAVLTFDSFSSAPAFGTRSAVTESRQLIYSVDDTDIDLHISTTDNKWTIAGQILGPAGCGAGHLHLESDDYQVTSELSESCEFRVSDVPSGEYKLRLTLADLELEVPRLALRK